MVFVIDSGAAIESTYLDRENASKQYFRYTNYRVQTLKTTTLVGQTHKLCWTYTQKEGSYRTE